MGMFRKLKKITIISYNKCGKRHKGWEGHHKLTSDYHTNSLWGTEQQLCGKMLLRSPLLHNLWLLQEYLIEQTPTPTQPQFPFLSVACMAQYITRSMQESSSLMKLKTDRLQWCVEVLGTAQPRMKACSEAQWAKLTSSKCRLKPIFVHFN